MTTRLGPVRQMGLVVNDFDGALEYWTQIMGTGPFFVSREVGFDDYRYRGQPSASPVLSLAYAQISDTMQLEIIHQHDDAPSGYRDFLRSGREGCQHLSSWFDSADAFDAAHAHALASGLAPIHEGSAGGPRFAYFDSYGAGSAGLAFEIAEGLLPMLDPVHEMMVAAARDWDGSDPVRAMPG
ncbi:VOC family protein [Croceicoccus mobilis]|uniref:Glyoxalase n=1 Tax=Croceicoccus mobilis TaxID=1703339 RepID=A0A917DXB4_9SPHN|nr:VOC family protein [Croceicoccus mobilis]GGD80464.1 glyoxalase [Croceicoccus mobilis]